jgi:uncharacterized protein YecE (DUF72 family)
MDRGSTGSAGKEPAASVRGAERRPGARWTGGRVWVGTSGYAYPEWRGSFYPEDLPASRYLAHAASALDSIELNGTFYSLKSPAIFQGWARAAEAPGFVFAMKGSRFITHQKRLAGVETALAHFYASGVLALGERGGPFLWQLPPGLAFDVGRVGAFLDLLPVSTDQAARLAGAPAAAEAPRPCRHAFEIRHSSFTTDAFFHLLERHGAALVVADTAGRFPAIEELTADFVYVRLHGAEVLYASRYRDDELARWADRIERWASHRDVYVYFDNTAEAHAPRDALRLRALLDARGVPRPASRAPTSVSSAARDRAPAPRRRRMARPGAG